MTASEDVAPIEKREQHPPEEQSLQDAMISWRACKMEERGLSGRSSITHLKKCLGS
jgi:hypothetical protein